MKIKKTIFGLAVAGVGALALASCSGSAKPNFICPESFDTETPVTITFWHTMGDNLQTVLNEAVTDFTKLYPNITVEHTQIGGYDDVRDQIVTNMGTGGYPNMAYCYPDHVALYNEAEITVSLDDVISNSKYGLGGSELKFTAPTQSQFIKAFYDEGACYGDGLMYTMPFLKSTEALFYDKTFFTANNLTVPTTWEEMWETCEKIKKIDPKACPLGYDSDSNWFITLAASYGFDYTSQNSFDFDNAGMRGLMKQLKGYYDKGYFTTQGIYGTYTNTLLTDKTLESKAYMCIGSTAGATYQTSSTGAFETGVAAIPYAANGKKKTISQGPSLVMFKNENPQAVLATWLFEQYLLTEEVQVKFAMTSGYLPVTSQAQANKTYTDNFLSKADGTRNGIAASATKQAIAQADTYFTSEVFIGSSYARSEVGSLLTTLMQDKSAVSDELVQSYFTKAINNCKYQAGQ